MPSSNHWIFLRGLAHEAGHWGEFIKDFEKNVSGARVHFLDLPGAGEFNAESSPASVKGMVEFLRKKARDRGVLESEPVNLLAISLGGMVALEWAASFPQEVEKLVLINSSLGRLNPFYKRMRWQAMPKFFHSALLRKGKSRESGLIDIVSNRKDIHHEVSDVWTSLWDDRPVSPLNAGRQLLAAAGYRGPGSEVCQPMLVLAGLGDRLVDPSCSEKLAKWYKQALYVEHPWGGHDLTLDDGHWVATQVSDWVEQNSL